MARAEAVLQRLRKSSLVDAIGLLLLASVLLFLLAKFFEDPTRFLNVAIIGATNGAVYGLVALGYTLVYGILQLINFAHGDVFALSGLVASTMIISVIEIGDVVIQWNKLAIFLIVIPTLLMLTWFVRSTRQGKAMRAVAQDREASAMLGIDVNRTISVTFFLAGSLAAVAGLVYLLQFNIRYDTGFELGLIAFTAAVLGGIGNLTGAVLGAMLIGMVQAFNEGLDGTPGGDWTRSIVFGILIAVLVFRPQGILGERTPEGA